MEGARMGFALANMKVTSPSFGPGGEIPSKYTGQGDNVPPALEWSDPPEGTRSFAVICHDPDAPIVSPDGTYGVAHWVVYNIPAEVTSLPEAVGGSYTTGPNQMGNASYAGPMPPPGHGPHHYYFWVLALKRGTDLDEGLSLWKLLEAVEPDLLGMNRLVGTYTNQQA